MRKFDLSLRSSRSFYFATFRHKLTILSKTDALDEEKWLNMLFFFFNDTATTEIYTLSLHDALPICSGSCGLTPRAPVMLRRHQRRHADRCQNLPSRSEEHTSELQSRQYLVCRLLLEKK